MRWKQLRCCDSTSQPYKWVSVFGLISKQDGKYNTKQIQNKYNDWLADHVSAELQKGTDPTDVKISSKLSDLKRLHARWIVDWYNNVTK